MFDFKKFSHGSTCTSSEDRKRLKTPDLVSSIRAAIYIQDIKTFDMYIIAADDHPSQKMINSAENYQRMINSAENYQSSIRRSSVLCTKMYL
jgi:hypothetical protein